MFRQDNFKPIDGRRDPAFLHDPELYAARFTYVDPDNADDLCKVDSENCTPHEADFRCDLCDSPVCEACCVLTGISDNRRCLDCEDRQLAKLQAACKLIGPGEFEREIQAALLEVED